MPAPLRGTQSLVGQMGWVTDRPSLLAVEVAWRWIFGIPLLTACWVQAQSILAALPLETTGFNSIDAQNPWIAVVQIANIWRIYAPHVFAVVHWLFPVAAVVWVVVASFGRSMLFRRIDPVVPFRPAALMMLHSIWLALISATFYAWFNAMGWAAATHIPSSGEPDLIGLAFWFIFLSLGFFTLWALISWPLTIAPVLMLCEQCSPAQALLRGLRLGKQFTGKLLEANLVMGIVTLALIVLAMVLSAAPLPFSDELGADALHVVWVGAVVFFLVASDYFQVVRLKGFVEFWKMFRGEEVVNSGAVRRD